MRNTRVFLTRMGLFVALSTAAFATVPLSPVHASGPQVSKAGTGSPTTGAFTPSGENDATDEAFAGGEGQESEAGPDPFDGSISLSNGTGHGSSADSAARAQPTPAFDNGFDGLTS